MFRKMHVYWEQISTKDFYAIKYSLYVADVAFVDLVDSFRNVGGAQALTYKINFQEELSNLEQTRIALPIRTRNFEPPIFVPCEYTSIEIKFMITPTKILKLIVLTMVL